MDTFLGRAVFPGPSIDATASAASFAGQARFAGYIAICNWSRREAAALLPPDLELASNSCACDEHPVVFIFGEQTEGAVRFAGLTVPMGIRYGEFALAVPFVKHRHGCYLHTYVPRMYSGYFPAVWHGNAYFGLAKEMARMWWQGPVFLMTNDSGALLLHATVETAAAWCPGAGCDLANFQEMRAIFTLPVLGRKADGSFVTSYFGWDFGAAEVRAADAYICVDAPFAAGLSPHDSYDVPSGTFEVRGMLWQLSWPTSCRF